MLVVQILLMQIVRQTDIDEVSFLKNGYIKILSVDHLDSILLVPCCMLIINKVISNLRYNRT